MLLFNENCEGRWVGKYGPVAWSTQMSDLNQLDFFCWTTWSWEGIMVVNQIQGTIY